MDIPSRIPGGLVDITLKAEAGDVPHHVAFFRLADGVTFDEFINADNDDGMMTFHGGNGTLPPGESVRLTLDLPAGNYAVIDMGEQNNASAAVTVEEPGGAAPEPDSEGTVLLGPGMALQVPEDFDLSGTWKMENVDTGEPHEATLLRLAPGKTVEDVVAWASTFEGEPPADFIGGFGAIGPGLHGWIDFEAPGAGEYALACFIPGEAGPHVADGMIAPLTIPE